MRIIAALALAVVVTAGCGDDGARQVPVVDARLKADGKTLELGLPVCDAEQVQVTTEESTDQVRVTVEVTGGSDDCASGTEVELARRLGDRPLIDTETGDPVVVHGSGT